MDTPEEILIVFFIISLIVICCGSCCGDVSSTQTGLPPPETIHQTPQPEQDIETGHRKALVYKDIKEEEGGRGEEEGGGKRFCPICLEEYEDDHQMRRLQKCGHVFHLLCIDSWLTRDPSCPCCRCSVDLMSLGL
ncbi:PREDICTED: RING-H2 finger protein ATL33-like [Camelina sativa]|uniref:RING-type E3 ubiquitin transferase n=1 Tax=Camelina sativa TaxID=90675 RepID=A0ABM0VWC7_CAMSA|nr:PREDICTED: RING-H2 finger protein ATL33-like [Camelina sativa]